MTPEKESLIRRPIKELIDELDPQTFWQIHRGTLVNVNAIAGVQRDIGGRMRVKLKGRKETLAVSEPYHGPLQADVALLEGFAVDKGDARMNGVPCWRSSGRDRGDGIARRDRGLRTTRCVARRATCGSR